MDLRDLAIPVPESGCWLWLACWDRNGYGNIRRGKKGYLAHRWVWEQLKGRPPIGNLLHKCDTPACVNPNHLFEGTQKQNMQDMASKGRASRASKAPGVLNGQAILTASQVLEILADRRSTALISEHHRVCRSTVQNIKAGRSWNSVTNLPKARKYHAV